MVLLKGGFVTRVFGPFFGFVIKEGVSGKCALIIVSSEEIFNEVGIEILNDRRGRSVVEGGDCVAAGATLAATKRSKDVGPPGVGRTVE